MIILGLIHDFRMLYYFQSPNAPTFVLKAYVKHDQIAEEFDCEVNFLPLGSAELAVRELKQGEEGERQKEGGGR